MPFMGEMMECCMCGKTQQSDPNIESGWTVLEVDNEPFYVCPKHLGKIHWTAKQHQKAYEKVLRRIKQILIERYSNLGGVST